MANRPLLLDPPIISNHRCSPITKDQVKEMVQDSVREAMESLKRLRKPTSLFELFERESAPKHPLPTDEDGVASRLAEQLATALEKLAIAKGVQVTAADREENEIVGDGELEGNEAAPASKLEYTCVDEMYAQCHVCGILLTV
jgi:hypothetical protein